MGIVSWCSSKKIRLAPLLTLIHHDQPPALSGRCLPLLHLVPRILGCSPRHNSSIVSGEEKYSHLLLVASDSPGGGHTDLRHLLPPQCLRYSGHLPHRVPSSGLPRNPPLMKAVTEQAVISLKWIDCHNFR